MIKEHIIMMRLLFTIILMLTPKIALACMANNTDLNLNANLTATKTFDLQSQSLVSVWNVEQSRRVYVPCTGYTLSVQSAYPHLGDGVYMTPLSGIGWLLTVQDTHTGTRIPLTDNFPIPSTWRYVVINMDLVKNTAYPTDIRAGTISSPVVVFNGPPGVTYRNNILSGNITVDVTTCNYSSPSTVDLGTTDTVEISSGRAPIVDFPITFTCGTTNVKPWIFMQGTQNPGGTLAIPGISGVGIRLSAEGRPFDLFNYPYILPIPSTSLSFTVQMGAQLESIGGPITPGSIDAFVDYIVTYD